MLEFMKDIVKDAGKMIKIAMESPTQIQEKESYADLVTDTDKKVEDALKFKILERFPSHNIIAEESAKSIYSFTPTPTWIIDPIDGTSNFVSHFPFCAISLAFYVDKLPQVSVIYNPIADQIFWAEKGSGAYLNGNKIHVSPCKNLHEALILTDWGGDRNPYNLDMKTANIRSLISDVRGIRTMGSAALHMCQVAAGQADAFYEFGIHCWDYAAALLIVVESGGYCCSYDGSSVDLMARHCICASNGLLANEICSRIKPILYPRD